MPRKAKTKTGRRPQKLEDFVLGKQYVWVLVRFADSRTFKIPADMLASIRMAKLGRERDLELQNEILGSKSGLLEIANSVEWDDVKMRAFLCDGNIQNVVSDERSEWRDAKKWVEENIFETKRYV